MRLRCRATRPRSRSPCPGTCHRTWSGVSPHAGAGAAILRRCRGLVQPAQAPIRSSSTMSTRDAGETAIEIRSTGRSRARRIRRNRRPHRRDQKTMPRRPSGWSPDRLSGGAAGRDHDRRPPNFKPRSPGQVAAGVTVPEEPPPDLTVPPVAGLAPVTATGPPTPPRRGQPQTQEVRVKVLVAPVTGAPSDGNRQLYSGHAPRPGLEQDHRRRCRSA